MNWTLAVATTSFLVGLLLVLALWQRTIEKTEHRRLQEELDGSAGHGPDRPVAQHPQINPYLCLGCSCCVRACPEHGALAVVDGTSRLVRPSRCVGHGHCELACPVGAIRVGLGDVRSREDVPILSSDLETSVPGVFICGELGGIGLIRNAIDQGRRVVETIDRRLRDQGRARGAQDPVDVLIVGSGPAGIAATLCARQLGLSHVTIDQDDLGGTVRKYPRNKLTMTQPVDLPLHGRMKRTQYTKEELIELWQGVVSKAGVQIRHGVRFLGLDCLPDGTLLAQTSAERLHTRTLVLALGRRGTPRRLGVPGEDSERVLYRLVDAAAHTSEHILVVGGGDSAVEAALALAEQAGNHVTISYRKEAFTRLKPKNQERIETAQRKKHLQVLFSSQVQRIEPDQVVLAVQDNAGEQERVIRADYVYVLVGGDPPFALLKGMGIRFGGDSTDRPVTAEPLKETKE